jgi:hypothetical protein
MNYASTLKAPRYDTIPRLAAGPEPLYDDLPGQASVEPAYQDLPGQASVEPAYQDLPAQALVPYGMRSISPELFVRPGSGRPGSTSTTAGTGWNGDATQPGARIGGAGICLGPSVGATRSVSVMRGGDRPDSAASILSVRPRRTLPVFLVPIPNNQPS